MVSFIGVFLDQMPLISLCISVYYKCPVSNTEVVTFILRSIETSGFPGTEKKRLMLHASHLVFAALTFPDLLPLQALKSLNPKGSFNIDFSP